MQSQGSLRQRGRSIRERERLRMICYWLEDEGRDHEPRNVDAPRNWKRQGMDSPLESPEGTGPA